MENVLTALFVIFINIFAVLTLALGFLGSVDTLQQSWRGMQDRTAEQAHTYLTQSDARIISSDSHVEFVYLNQGATKLTDFETWDVIVQYTDASDAQHIAWLPYTNDPIAANKWSVLGLYADESRGVAEVYEPNVLNPGEQLVIHLTVTPPVGHGKPIQVIAAAGNGASVAAFFIRNIPPQLVMNQPLSLYTHNNATITSLFLESTDADDTDESLIYHVISAPTQGTLSLGDSFTQAEIDNERLIYTHTGTGDTDSFTFEVTDGKDTIGVYTFTLMILNASPTLNKNNGLIVPSTNTVTISASALEVTDIDNTPDTLAYQVTTLPTLGTLNLGTMFTQADIDSGLLQYTHTALNGGSDYFDFTVTDGQNTIGTYRFQIVIP